MKLVRLYDISNDEIFLVHLLDGQVTLDDLEAAIRDREKYIPLKPSSKLDYQKQGLG